MAFSFPAGLCGWCLMTQPVPNKSQLLWNHQGHGITFPWLQQAGRCPCKLFIKMGRDDPPPFCLPHWDTTCCFQTLCLCCAVSFCLKCFCLSSKPPLTLCDSYNHQPCHSQFAPLTHIYPSKSDSSVTSVGGDIRPSRHAEEWLAAWTLELNLSASTNELCDIGKVTSHLWASVCSSVNWECEHFLHKVVLRSKLVC